MNKERLVYFNSGSGICGVWLVRWQRKLLPFTYMWNPKEKKFNNKIRKEHGWRGVGAVVRSEWLWDWPDGWRYSRKNKLPRKHSWLAPHTELFLTYDGCKTGRGRTLRRPTMAEYKTIYGVR